MKNTGTLRIQAFAARQSAPVEGVTVAVQGDGFTLHRITDATGSAADIPVEAPARMGDSFQPREARREISL